MNNEVNKYKLIDLRHIIKKEYDLFICFSSFEDRCLSIANNINIDNIKQVLLMYNKEYLEYIEKNKIELEKLFYNKSMSIELSHLDPILSADTIKNVLAGILGKKELRSILFDITTCTHEILLISIRLFQIICPNTEITYIYANAAEYDSGNVKDNKWLSKGIEGVRSVLGYAGNIIPIKKTHLIVIVGYEYERAANIIDIMEPSSLELGYGKTDNATTDKDKDANEHYLHLVEKMAVLFTETETFDIKCNNPFDTYAKLSERISKVNDKNIIIVPLNNKISTVGVAITAIKNDKIQLCYAPALVYNYSNYSNPGEYCYVFEISNILNEN
jgi:hypothetical protein